MREALDGCDDRDFVDFVGECLTWGAGERLTRDRALLHPWTGRMGLLDFTRAAAQETSTTRSAEANANAVQPNRPVGFAEEEDSRLGLPGEGRGTRALDASLDRALGAPAYARAD